MMSVPQQNGQYVPPSQPGQAQWNGATGLYTPQSNTNAMAMSAHGGYNVTGKDAIREGKQRARETMAAAGVQLDGPSGTGNSAHSSYQANGAPQLSRKRSRDGTRLPVAQTPTSAEPSSTSIPDRNEVLLDRIVQRDLLFESAIIDDTLQAEALVEEKRRERDFYVNEVRPRRRADPGAIFGRGYQGYGNGRTDNKNDLIYHSQRKPPKGRRSKELYIPRKDKAAQAEQRDELIPIRLDIELDKLRLRDTFTWNLYEKTISQDMFTDYLLEDLKLPPEATYEVGRQIKQEMQEQISTFYPHLIVEDGSLEPGRPYTDHKDDELRIVIKLNITIGRIALVDQFEWDINNPLNSPEEFARNMAYENALSGEFTTAIAHAIREQSQLYTRSLWLTNHNFDGRPVEDPDLRDAFLPNPIHSAFRPVQSLKDWMPFMYEMTEADLERTETSMMREHRAQKRQLNRRGGPALPDLKEKQRTVRSLLVHSVIPGAVETFETTGILKTRRSGRGARRGGARLDGDVDSEELESDESGPDSPNPSSVNIGTTARTRGMRGAASAAQAAMRAGYGRSETPDLQLTPHESRTVRGRSHLREEDGVDDDTLIVKLRIGKAKLKAFWNELDAKKRASQYPLSGYASQPPPIPVTLNRTSSAASRSVPPAHMTPQPNGHQRAPSASASAKQKQQIQYDTRGHVEIDHQPQPDDEPVS